MKIISNSKHNNRGFTLVEMMVALTLGVIVLAGISQIFIKTKRATVFQDELARMQENSRYAIQLLNKEIRNAGYLGCRHSSNIDASYLDTGGTYFDNFSLAVEGYEADGTAPGSPFTVGSITAGWSGGNGTESTLPAALGNPNLVPGSDIIIIRYAHGSGLTLAQEKQNNSDVQVINISQETNSCNSGSSDGFSGLCIGDLAIISDCERAHSFQISNLDLDGSGILTIRDATGNSWVGEHNSTVPFTVADSSLFGARTVAFFVRNNSATPAVPSLYRKIGNGNAQELVEGVENMQVAYGEDTDNDGVPNRYLAAHQVGDFSNVTSIQLSLLLRTIHESSRRSAAAKTLSMLSADVTTPSDHHYRQVFTTTIQLRNPDE